MGLYAEDGPYNFTWIHNEAPLGSWTNWRYELDLEGWRGCVVADTRYDDCLWESESCSGGEGGKYGICEQALPLLSPPTPQPE